MADIIFTRAVTKSFPYEPSAGSIQILRALAQYHYLTVEQILRLFYKPTSITTVQTRMKELTIHGYCERRPLPLPAFVPGGSGAYVYTLGPKGRTIVDAQGLEVPARFRPSEIPQKNQLAHIVACSDVYVSATRLCQGANGLELERLVHERVLRRLGERVQVNGKPRRVTPDGWLSIIGTAAGRRFRYPIALEVDMGSEKQTKWRDKVRGLLAWMDSPSYEKLFATKSVTVAVACPGKPKHAGVLCAWTAAELAALNRHRDAKHFLFTGMDAAATVPYSFFCELRWQEPFGLSPVSLIELEAGGG
jgi:Replication-relaxation